MHKRPLGLLTQARWLLPATAFALLGCPNEELAPLEPCTVSGVSEEITQTGVDQVDLLFVIDNSGSMKEEQEILAEQLPKLVRTLVTGHWEGDSAEGRTDFTPVASLNLGVISTDMGAAGVEISTCQGKGNDGILIDEVINADNTDPDCQDLGVEEYQTFEPGTEEDPTAAANEVARKFACIASLGTDGCGFEQQLEAMLKALAPNRDTSFIGGSGGHGDEANRGFLREESVLAIIHVSDEEDCSAKEEGRELFTRETTNPDFLLESGATIQQNVRCGLHRDNEKYVWPVSRYIEGLKELREDNPDRLIFAAIVGIPLDLEGAPLEEIIDDPRMEFVPADNNNNPGPANSSTGPVSACQSADTKAGPGRRFVQVAQAFNQGELENGIIRSICADDYSPALDVIIEKISKQLKGACLPRALNPNADGIVECDVVEVLKRGDNECDESAGRTFQETRNIGGGDVRTVCKINQVAVPNRQIPQSGVGWYYDNFSDGPNGVLETCADGFKQRIAFMPNSDPASGSSVRFECFQPVARIDPEATGREAVASPCDPDVNGQCEAKSDDLYSLTCEGTTRTCQIVCQDTSQCPPSWACALTSDGGGYCINPTCPPSAS